MNRQNQLNSKLTRIGGNTFLHKDDPLYWQKMLKIDPTNQDAWFHVAKQKDEEAQELLNKFIRSKNKKFEDLYLKKKREALNDMYKAQRYGHSMAEKEIHLMTEELYQYKRDPKFELGSSQGWKYAVIFSLGFAVGVFLLVMLIEAFM